MSQSGSFPMRFYINLNTGEATCHLGELDHPDYMYCDGRALKRSEYHVLFSLIGTIYGSLKQDEFNIPDYSALSKFETTHPQIQKD